jgi:hypothetical protein
MASIATPIAIAMTTAHRSQSWFTAVINGLGGALMASRVA